MHDSKRVEPENFPHNGHSACTHSSAQWRARSELILTPPCRRPWRAAPLAQLMRFRDRALPGQPHCADARYSPPNSVRGWKHHRCDFTKCAKAFSVHENIARDCEQRGIIHVTTLQNPRHERFAQELATGKSADAAYVLAGYRTNRSNAARLSANQHIRNRVAEIQSLGAERAAITVETLIAEAEEARSKAKRAALPRLLQQSLSRQSSPVCGVKKWRRPIRPVLNA